MLELVIINIFIIIIDTVLLLLLRKYVKSEKIRRILMIVLPVLTILFHYSSFIILAIKGDGSINYLKSNPNLILPIYPCNIVMWCCLILGIVIKKENHLRTFLIDYIFYFGLISALGGMFGNVDFIRSLNDPSLNSMPYESYKSVIAHGFMLANIIALPCFGYVKIDLPHNFINILISIVMMYIVGIYCNLVFRTLCDEAYANEVNSMFILHSPFDGLGFLNFYFIAGIAVIGYFGIFALMEQIAYKKENRWYKRKFKW